MVKKKESDDMPNLTPRQIFRAGVFGGGYYRDIYSSVTGKKYTKAWKEFPESWWKGLDTKTYLESEIYDKTLNKYGVDCGAKLNKSDTFGLKYWEYKKWITPQDPYGWVQWYCRYYEGRRSDEDVHQIERWRGVAGENGRFRNRLINMCASSGKAFDDPTVSPVIRQVLLQWGYKLTEADYKKALLKKK